MFKDFQKALKEHFQEMDQRSLFRVDIEPDKLWEKYLASFPPGTNEVFRERTEHDCSCCRAFIKKVGGLVSIEDNQLVSIWDVEVEGFYQEVADKMGRMVRRAKVNDLFLHYEKGVGTLSNRELIGDEVHTWSHFHLDLPPRCVVTNQIDLNAKVGEYRESRNVFKRGLEELTSEALNIVLDLIDQDSLYRGAEFKTSISKFLQVKTAYEKLPKKKRDNFCWANAALPCSRLRNTAIGQLLINLSDDMDLDTAVKKYESIVAPANYKRPKALITPRMIKDAKKKIEELGIEEALYRRHATLDDVNINDILYTDKSLKKEKDLFEQLIDDTPVNLKKLSKVEEISIDDFIEKVVPKAEKIELLVENRHNNNFMSILAPKNGSDAKIFKWDNLFSWSYNNNTADSMKERVKSMGGNVEGILRFSLQWNEDGQDQNDLDAHCREPDRNLIFYQNKGRVHRSSGMLDVDIITPGKDVAVENIAYTHPGRMKTGVYTFLVHCYSYHGGTGGFRAEVEFDGVIHSFNYPKPLRQDEKVTVAQVKMSKHGFEMVKSLDSIQENKEVWGVTTNRFHEVSMIMNSPNFWDGSSIGNKHFFFILNKCRTEDKMRGFYNEFLLDEHLKHRKVFEVLGNALKVEPSEQQLSGLGFSITQRNSVICRVSGSFSRTVKINF